MLDLIIEEFNKEYQNSMHKIYNQVFSKKPWSTRLGEKGWKNHLESVLSAQDNIALVAKLENKPKNSYEVAGFILGYRSRYSLDDNIDEKNLSFVLDLAVGTGYKRKGIGTALMTDYITRVALFGFKYIGLVTSNLSEEARSFYGKFNFEDFDKIATYDDFVFKVKKV